ncbi:unnamed protein product [Rhizoctonia solani]|uniref:PB1 domain-containing protein n=1 Tax=Rhizoctonia solani TaxID=456999 RepID=A0A8H3B4G3_9AGAM|nr:unnamed protein product [Rhizoctonia solani]
MARAYSDYGSVSSMRGDIPLVVKCTFDRSMRRITFQSAQTCTYELLRARIEECFSLAASSFTISYTDDDAEVTDINSDNDLTEAVAYFQVGEEIGSSGGSVYSYRSSGPKKITLRVTVTVDYDGPSLSDTASLVSMEEYAGARARAQAELRGNTNGFGLPPEEDAITLNSHSAPATAAAAPHGIPDDFSLSGTDDGDGGVVETADVFQRLRLDTSTASLPSERGVQWLREQNAYTMRTVLGVEPEPSVSEVTDAEPDPPRSAVDSRAGDLALEMDERGNYYYTYTSESASVAEPEPHPQQSGASQHNLNWLASHQQPQPQPQPKAQSTKSSSSSSQSTQPYSLESRASSSNTDVTPPPLPPRRVNPADYPGIPPEVLQFISAEAPGLESPDRVTDCSACGVVLDSFRYVCSTCGEKPSRPTQPESPITVIDGGGKGKERAVDPFADEHTGVHTYPPGGSSRGAGYGWTYSEDYSRANPNVTRTRTSPHASQVHDIHPIHTFLVVPVTKPSERQPYQPIARFSIDSQDQTVSKLLLAHGFIAPFARVNAASRGIVFSIPYPLDKREVNDASRRALDLWDSRDGPALGVQRPRANSVGSNQARTVLGTANKDIAIDHHILCKGCGVCFQCEQKSHLIHDPYHVFLKLPRPVDRPIESPYPVIPVVYSEPVGGYHRGPEPRGWAVCPQISPIVGAWFRCITCGKDYCDECESIGGHDPTHIFVVFKSRVDTHLIGAITDLTLRKPPPIWPHEVYLS